MCLYRNVCYLRSWLINSYLNSVYVFFDILVSRVRPFTVDTCIEVRRLAHRSLRILRRLCYLSLRNDWNVLRLALWMLRHLRVDYLLMLSWLHVLWLMLVKALLCGLSNSLLLHSIALPILDAEEEKDHCTDNHSHRETEPDEVRFPARNGLLWSFDVLCKSDSVFLVIVRSHIFA